MQQPMQQPDSWSTLWMWMGRLADLIGLLVGVFGIPAIVISLGRLRQRVSASRTIEATPLGLNSGFTGLLCSVSAPFPASSDPARQPETISNLVRENEHPAPQLWESPIGSVLKAMEHHKRDLRYCWLIASEDSKSYLKALVEAANKYFPNVKVFPEIVVPDVYERIDGVYDAVHGVFNRCEEETGGRVRAKDIITDVTAGTKIMSIAVALACLDASRNIEYIEQKHRKEFYKIDISWEKIAKRPSEKR